MSALINAHARIYTRAYNLDSINNKNGIKNYTIAPCLRDFVRYASYI